MISCRGLDLVRDSGELLEQKGWGPARFLRGRRARYPYEDSYLLANTVGQPIKPRLDKTEERGANHSPKDVVQARGSLPAFWS